MTEQDFLNMSLVDLNAVTGIQTAQWCRYLKRRQEMNLKTLRRAAHSLDMRDEDLLAAIERRRILSDGKIYDARRLGK